MPSSFLQSSKKQWREFLRSPPGHRFQKVYHNRQTSRSTEHPRRRTGLLVIGVIIAIVGVALLPLPGPGMIVVAAGLILIARESLIAARILDFADERIHIVVHYLRNRWERWSTTKRVVCAAIAGALLVGMAAGAWLVLTT